jgi:hydrogenase maturation protease
MLQTVELQESRLWQQLRPACIICLGNELASDDGVGMRLGRLLRSMPLPEHVVVHFSPQIDLDLIDYLLTAERIIFCDATRLGLAAGAVTVHDWQSTANLSSQPYCCHGIGLSELLTIAAELEPQLDRWVIHLVGIEASILDTFGTRLSREVQAALPGALREVLRLLAAPDDLLACADALAREVRSPSALEAAMGCP